MDKIIKRIRELLKEDGFTTETDRYGEYVMYNRGKKEFAHYKYNHDIEETRWVGEYDYNRLTENLLIRNGMKKDYLIIILHEFFKEVTELTDFLELIALTKHKFFAWAFSNDVEIIERYEVR